MDALPTTASDLDQAHHNRRRRMTGLAAAVVLIGLVAALVLARPNPSGPNPGAEAPEADSTGEYVPSEVQGQLSFAVDASLAPDVAEVGSVHEGDAPRPTARMVDSAGQTTDLVLDELMITTDDRGALDDFLARWHGVVVDEMPATAADARRDYLVRVDPSAVDAEAGPDALLALEPHQPGQMRFSHQAALELIALAALDGQQSGLAATPVWLLESTAIEDGTLTEAADAAVANAFDWSYLRDGGPQDIGVAPAWQLLGAHDRLDDERVRIMIVDGGFYPNPDFPDTQKIRKGQWHEVNDMTCGGGSLCPWHGSNVTMAAMGRLDNGYGTAGPAGPVAELVALVADTDSYTRLKKVREVAAEEHPDIVNMSYATGVTSFRGIAEDTYNRHFGEVRSNGATLFAAAGNDGVDVDSRACIGDHCWETLLQVPCESREVICVGGMRTNATFKADGSNFGSRPGTTSVELWAPYCMRVLQDAGDPYYEPETENGCGTSYSSPFVAGIAALLLAADPSMDAGDIREVLADTAHVGGVHFEHVIPTDGQRRVDALAAVERVLGVTPDDPTVAIESPTDGTTFPLETWLELRSTATSFGGGPLPVAWISSIDGDLGVTDLSGDMTALPLSEGTHVLTAMVADTVGQSAMDQITVVVGNSPPTVKIGGGLDGSEYYAGQQVDLIGFTADIEQGALPDDDVRWEIRRDGQLVHEAVGHVAFVPLTIVDPGAYDVTFIGHDGALDIEDTAQFDVVELPEGETAPNVGILEPTMGRVYGIHGALKAQVHLLGSAYDLQDGQLSGTRFRWTATSQAGTKVTLCTGSAFPGAGGGGGGLVFGVLKDCADTWVELGIDPAAMGEDGVIDPTLWTISLEAADSAGIVTKRSVGVTVMVAVG